MKIKSYDPSGVVELAPRIKIWTKVVEVWHLSPRLFTFWHEDFKFFSCIILCKINWPPWRKQFWAHIWTNFEEVLQAILHNKYLSTRHCFRQEHFWRLPNVNLCKNKWSLWPMGHNLKNLCRRSDRGSYTTNISALWWFPFGCLGNWFRFRTL